MNNHLKFIAIAAACCLSLSSAFAQQRYYYDDREGSVASYLDLHIGDGLGRGAKGFGGGTVSFLYRFSSDFQFGVGGGVDFYKGLALQGGAKKDKEFDYHGELSIPVFLRGRYALGGGGYYDQGAQFFAQCDFGTRIGLSAYNSSKNSGITALAKNFERCNVKGLFVEPQIGIAPNRTISFALGFPFQRYQRNVSPVSIDQTTKDTEITTKDMMFSGANIHFMICF